MSSKQQFNEVLHLMRGIAIFLVVLGHSFGHIGEVDNTGVASASSHVIFSFHMHLFFFVSGFVGAKFFSCERAAYAHTVARQFKRLMVVYFSYTAVAVIAKLVAQAYVRRPVEASKLLADIFIYPTHNPLLVLWFIYTLFVVQITFLTWHALIRADYTKWAHVAVTLGILLTLQGLFWNFSNLPLGLDLAAELAPYLFLGYIASLHRASIESWLRRYMGLVLCLGLCYMVYAYTFHASLSARWPAGFVHAVAGITLTWALGLRIVDQHKMPAAFFRLLADYSYDIYLNAAFFSQPTVIFFRRLLACNHVILFPFEFPIALIGPILLSKYVYRRSRLLRRIALGDWRS